MTPLRKMGSAAKAVLKFDRVKSKLMSGIEVATLATISDMSLRSVRFLTDYGVLKPDVDTVDAGTGVRRRYSPNETAIACVISRLACAKMAAHKLKQVADMLRPYFRGRPRAVESARSDIGPNYLTIGFQRDGTVSVAWHGATINLAEVLWPRDRPAPSFVAVVDLNSALAGMR